MYLKEPFIIKGNSHSDSRGVLKFNNDFDLTRVKRVYSISNSQINNVRGWQGHLIEKRWFMAVDGVFKINVAAIRDWPLINRDQDPSSFTLENNADVLYVPEGHVTRIEQVSIKGSLMVFADYFLKEIDDEYRLELDYFSKS